MEKEEIIVLENLKTYYQTLVNSCDTILNHLYSQSKIGNVGDMVLITVNDLSSRSWNILYKHHQFLGIDNIYKGITFNELSKISLKKLKKCYGCGEAVIKEINQL
mgnify:FL=1